MGHGLTDNYLRVFSEAGAGLTRQLTEVELVALTEGGVVGQLCSRSARGPRLDENASP
jgi:hypothetical protein